MRRDQRLTIITEAIERLIPGAVPDCLSVEVKETLSTTGCVSNTWAGSPTGLAERLFIAVYGSPAAQGPRSPLAQAEDAKRARDLVGEVGALMDGYARLTTAPWYPARPGDLVHVHHEAGTLTAPFGETYLISAGQHGFLSMQLLAHTLPEAEDTAGRVGCYAVDDDPDPLTDLWMEAGPHRLTVVRDGQVVHDGAARRVGGPAPSVGMLRTCARTVHEAERYLERGEPELALARLRLGQPLPPCGAPGVLPEHQPCARPRGHGPGHSPDADYREGPHECPALPEQLHAVVTVGAQVDDVHIAGLYENQEAAVDHLSGFICYAEEDSQRYVKRYAHGGMVLELPEKREQHGVQLAVVMPLDVLPDPRAVDEWAAEGMAVSMEPDPDYGRDLDTE